MTIHQLIFSTHIITAVSALILGGIAILVPKSKGYHTKVGEAYFWTISYAMIAAFYLAAERDSIFFILLSLTTIYTALQGYLAAKTRKLNPVGWKKKHLKFVSASYIGCWTAVAVLEFPGPQIINWLWPTLIGTFLVRRFMRIKALA